MPRPVAAAVSHIIFDDGLNAEWQNWSWDTTIDFASADAAHDGATGMRVVYNGGWAGVFLHSDNAVATAEYDSLTFWVRTANGAQDISVSLVDASGNGYAGSDVMVNGTWQQITLPLSALGNPSTISGIMLQEYDGAAGTILYFDQLQLAGSDSGGEDDPTPVGAVSMTVDTVNVQHQINDDIYGMNFAEDNLVNELGLSVNRWGGNAVTRYNWQLDVSNRGADWYFENIPNDADVSQLPTNSASDRFAERNKNRGGTTIMTMPLIGWTPSSRDWSCGFAVSRYGQQASTDPWRPDCGNGLDSNWNELIGNDPSDTSTAIDTKFVTDWINHLVGRFGRADQGGVQYYALDNEPMLWDHTHRDVHPEPATYDEVRDRGFEYGAAIKAADPTAKTFGPVTWGWTAYFYSAADAASGNWDNPPDRAAHGDIPFTDWYLQEMARYEAENGTRILDYLDLHFYPQQAGVALQPAGNLATQQLRLRSTRALWDRTYSDESWIGEPIYMLPRMHDWVDNNYPDTQLALTEYNFGGLEHINGALAQADVLGIFGREGLDLATIWDPPVSSQPGAYAFRMYRNYDGNGGRFGDQSLSATTSNDEQLSIFAARRSSDNALTVMVVNKAMAAMEGTIMLNGLAPTSAEAFRYSSDNLNQIVQLDDAQVSGGELSEVFPADSITLFVLSSTPTAVNLSAQSASSSISGSAAAIFGSLFALTPLTLRAWKRQ